MFHHFFGGTGVAATPPSLLATGSVGGEVSTADLTRVTQLIVPAGLNRLAVVFVSIRNSAGEGVNGVSSDLDGALTVKSTVQASAMTARAELWYLVAPSEGTHSITVTFNSAARAIAFSQCYKDVHPIVPFGTAATASGLSGDPATVDVTSAGNELVIDVLARVDDEAVLAGVGQTAMLNTLTTSATSSENIRAGVSREVGAATVTMSWALYSEVRAWALLAIALKPA